MKYVRTVFILKSIWYPRGNGGSLGAITVCKAITESGSKFISIPDVGFCPQLDVGHAKSSDSASVSVLYITPLRKISKQMKCVTYSKKKKVLKIQQYQSN